MRAQQWMEGWRKLAVETEQDYRVWTAEHLPAFVSPRLLAMLRREYKGVTLKMALSDVLRYAVLHCYGGTYADIDIEVRKPEEVGPYTIPDEVPTMYCPVRPRRPANGLLTFKEGDDLLCELLAEAEQRMESIPSAGVLYTTGPAMLRDVSARGARELLYVNPPLYTFDHWPGVTMPVCDETMLVTHSGWRR